MTHIAIHEHVDGRVVDWSSAMFAYLRFVVMLACAISSLACGESATAPSDPSHRLTYAEPGKLGVFPVGVVTMPFIDGARPELSTLDTTDRRTLPTTIWYPAGEAARTAAKALRRDLLPPPVAEALAVAGAPGVLDVPTNSVVAAEIASGGPFPLIVFSHGNGGLGAQSYFLTEFLASHGYIVVGPDHTGNALLTQLPGNVVVPQGGQADSSGGTTYGTAAAASDRFADASFLVDTMTELNASDPNRRFTGAVDLERVGITGHSFGGLTTLVAISQDHRFDVAAPMAPAAPEASDIDEPVMYFWATQDQTLPLAPVQSNYEAVTSPKMFIAITDAGHFSFSNGCPFGIGNANGCGSGKRLESGETFMFLEDVRVHEITNFYQTALFGYYLKDVRKYADDLRAEPFSGQVTIQRDGMP